MNTARSSDTSDRILKIGAHPAFKNASSNPYNSLLYSEIRKQGPDVFECTREDLRHTDFDVFHLHWPETYLETRSLMSTIRSARKTLSLFDRARRRGVKLLWTIHNLRPHDRRHAWLEDRFLKEVTKRADGVIALSDSGLESARRKWASLADVRSFVIPHGHYRDAYPNAISRDEARATLDIRAPSVVIAYVGLIRPYKNVPRLIRTFRELERPGSVLLVAGKPQKEACATDVRSAAAGDDSVHLHLNRVEDDELQLFLNAADLVVLPFKDILNSGSALLALSFDRPVLVPRLGTMAELESSIGSDWVRTYEGELTADVLRDAMPWALYQKRGCRAPLDDIGWSSVACKTIQAYSAITTKTTPRSE